MLFEKNDCSTKDYVYGLGELQAIYETKGTGTKKYFHFNDVLGSTRFIWEMWTGEVVQETICSPFGNQILDGHKAPGDWLTYRFAGHNAKNEATGLIYMQARWMCVESGRFISPDPAKQGINYYIYAQNNPTSLIDPDGRYSFRRFRNSTNYLFNMYFGNPYQRFNSFKGLNFKSKSIKKIYNSTHASHIYANKASKSFGKDTIKFVEHQSKADVIDYNKSNLSQADPMPNNGRYPSFADYYVRTLFKTWKDMGKNYFIGAGEQAVKNTIDFMYLTQIDDVAFIKSIPHAPKNIISSMVEAGDKLRHPDPEVSCRAAGAISFNILSAYLADKAMGKIYKAAGKYAATGDDFYNASRLMYTYDDAFNISLQRFAYDNLDIVLGHQFNVSTRGLGHGPLIKYQKLTGARTYYSWKIAGLTKFDPTDAAQFRFAFNEAARNSRKIHFGIDSLNLSKTYKVGGFPRSGIVDNFTAFEFRTIIDSPILLDKTFFWQNGKVITTDRILQRIFQKQ